MTQDTQQHVDGGARGVSAWMLPNSTVFFASACIMTLELVAGRLIARHVGMSLYTWTSVIGVIMAGIALGNYLGGRIADRYRPRHTLALLFFVAAIGSVCVLPLNALAGTLLEGASFSWPIRIFLHVFIAFLAPAVALGTITPVVARMALNYERAAGRTVGGVFAWAVAGSLVGTFVAGFYLIMTLGATTIVLLSAAGLFALGVLYTLIARYDRIVPVTASSSVSTGALVKTLSDWAPAALTVFVSNMAFMVFELAALRVIAREYGSSLYTWTTVIGVVLGGVSLGNYLGGRLADRFRSAGTIAAVFSCSAFAVLTGPLGGAFIDGLRYYLPLLGNAPWPLQILVHVLAFCFIPCVFIGMVSPIVTRRLLEQGRAPGAAVGAVYAWGAVGAIFGTFLAGYFLIQWVGSLPVVAVTALLLALVASVYAPRNIAAWGMVALCAFALTAALAPVARLDTVGALLRLRVPAAPHTVYEDESQYTYIAVHEDQDEPGVRELKLDQLIHTKVDLNDPARLLYDYEWVYGGVTDEHAPPPAPVNAFVIGGGGYAYPNYLAHTRPGSAIVVAEIDPAVTEAAHAAMGLPRDTPIEIHDRDARIVVADLLRRKRNAPDFVPFDFIFGDSINNYTVPYHLTTIEFKEMIYELLRDDGIYMLNMIDMFDSGMFLAAVVNTCRQVFPQVSVFNTGGSFATRDTFIVVCMKKPAALNHIPRTVGYQYAYRGMLLFDTMVDALIERHGGLVLTDDFAPVENLVAPVAGTREGDKSEINVHYARRYAARGAIGRAIEHCKTALSFDGTYAEARELLAELHFMEGDVDAGLEALRRAAEHHQEPAALWFRMGMAALDAGMTDRALNAWNRCVALQPDHTEAWYNLGAVHVMRKEYPQAVQAWEQVLEYEPGHEDSLVNLARLFVMAGDGPSAAAILEAMREQGIPVDPPLEEAVQTLPPPAPTQE